MKKTVILVILDGWGLGQQDISNPIYVVKPPTINYIKSHFPAGALQASGIAVGLPWGEEGNSEVGHLIIGAGKIIYQHLPRINMAIESGDFFQNKALLDAISHVQKNNSSLNLVGILAQGNVHASLNHLLALIKITRDNSIGKINLHLFADGKDSPQKFFLILLEKLDLNKNKDVKLASVSGRYFAMDRDNHWDRTQLTYSALIGRATITEDIKSFIESQYQKGLIDEYLQPVLLGPENHGIKDNDAIIFFNYREDSMRQIAETFTNPKFSQFPIFPLKNLYMATMTNYFDGLVDSLSQIIFPPEKIENSLGKVLADNNKNQLRIAETEKYAHVTYFFNGLKYAPLVNEYHVLIPSKTIAHQDENPEMMASEITNRIIQAVEDKNMDFILANYANADVIAHTGNHDASIQAVKVIDAELNKLIKVIFNQPDTTLIITADHGNIEQMINPLTGLPEAKHNPSPVPIYIVSKELERNKNSQLLERIEKETVGLLSDVAPTVLDLLDIPKPIEMTGESLLKKLN